MIAITLPDGSRREFPGPVTVAEVAQSIGAGLAKAALAGRIDGQLVDTSFRIEQNVDLAIVTDKDTDGLDVIRHSTAHLLAYAVKELYPEAQVTIGPVIENGFYYDFAYKRPFTPEDLVAIEKRMAELAKKDEKVTREVWSRDDAVKLFEGMGEKYKAEIIASIPEDQEIGLYREGNFVDLCRGPHVPSTGKLKVFKLMKVAGAYWRGDSNNEMLQRIYGTAWAKKEDQEAYLHMLEEAEKRDHRKLGKLLDLFHLQEEAPGMVFWHPKGWQIWQAVEQYMRGRLAGAGYSEVRTPQVMDRGLWERSGHWENYKENMFVTESEKREYAIKPMNCPGHVQIFNHGLRSYRDLPLRLAEFGACHRNEPSGALHGLMRVRGFVQDDAHIFCTEGQIMAEAKDFNDLAFSIYEDFGFENVAVKLALRPDKRAGTDEIWDHAEEGLRTALRACGVEWEELPGEGAFYGPKVEYHIKDAIGRSWQCGTLQLDLVLPERLGAEYVAEDNSRKRPVMLHRAILGSFERFLGILLENHAGALPLWLAPEQVVIMSIADAHAEYAESVAQSLQKQGFRASADLRNEKITYKIREHSLQKVPYLVVVGDKERDGNQVAVRARGNVDLGSMPVSTFVERLQNDFANKS
ncbi:threonine--tRNA ligase [Ralstonia nicotianae]|uniref:Threonine--tRNA ligase n=4 Tax=Ralstonia solanacearum species complex TaxID=3116862 RepID=SYT_RALN1|nr:MULTISPECIES: threonine--tRNA ligase [Ralstonia]Q8XZ29.1 RecName: Full=Threonine--tRNA ligase; AltName: Full=Threonyl-tRNA synthetase; Short=ThrRS [Ralstonia pseudosolanacearum GMI1000]AUS44728.1 threonine--tRNA ligase [Ralstonia solanacearum]AST27161.1 threonine--tRNA ligase [Ralstonia pseudosolanacearum]AYA46442.1 threonine--tRNA ligase [Ralstonia pseudosolanacearum]KAF3459894.1 threonine--tRNA ligase [Ralstonia solanacearum]MBX9429797.1 threonine--tRNA ligase [Ralstonia pseudosolanacear